MFGFGKRKKEKLAKQQAEQAQKLALAQQQEAQKQLAQTEQELSVRDDHSQSVAKKLDEALSQAVAQSAAQSAAQTNQEPDEVQTQQADATELATEIEAQSDVVESDVVVQTNVGVAQQEPAQEKPQEKKSWFSRIKLGLGKTRANLTDGLANLFLGKKVIDDELLEDIETQLLLADVGMEATQAIIKTLTEKTARKELADPQAMFQALKHELALMLGEVEQPLILKTENKPYVILMVGINGVGKTTTIGKLAKRFKTQGHSVMLAAGDTFRAAAVEQLQAWGERNDVPVVAQHTGADSASVLFDALQSAKTKKVDVLIADTAGRLHNKDNLMGELEKIVRVMKKIDPQAPHEVMLVLDAGTGQNAINQAREFNKCVNVTGLTLTKLDGTAKGGVIFALAKQLQIPLRFIGVGEQADDLRDFNSKDFVNALFTEE